MSERPDAIGVRERHIERELASKGKPDERRPLDPRRVEYSDQVVDRRERDAGDSERPQKRRS
jgi:hypothetical protein